MVKPIKVPTFKESYEEFKSKLGVSYISPDGLIVNKSTDMLFSMLLMQHREDLLKVVEQINHDKKEKVTVGDHGYQGISLSEYVEYIRSNPYIYWDTSVKSVQFCKWKSKCEFYVYVGQLTRLDREAINKKLMETVY